jgi:Skp family chaperone for outer membrane proteins
MKMLPVYAALVAGVSLAAAPAAFAQTAGGVVANGIGVANSQAVVFSSNAYKAAVQQLQVTYKPQFDQFKARKAALRAQLAPLVDKFKADRAAAKPDNALLQSEYTQIQQIQQTGQQELEQIIEPVNLGRQYAVETISEKLEPAVQAAMTKRRVTIVLDAQSVIKADQVYNLNQDILDQLNLIIPSVGVTPPAGWLPREQRERAAQEQAAAAAEAAESGAAAPAAKKQPQGR